MLTRDDNDNTDKQTNIAIVIIGNLRKHTSSSVLVSTFCY